MDKYLLLIFVPRKEALAAVNKIDSDIVSTQTRVVLTTVLFSIGTIVGVLLIGLWISNIIARPVQKLTNLANQITRNATKKDLLEGITFDATLTQDDEIGDLTRSFSNLVETLKKEKEAKES